LGGSFGSSLGIMLLHPVVLKEIFVGLSPSFCGPSSSKLYPSCNILKLGCSQNNGPLGDGLVSWAHYLENGPALSCLRLHQKLQNYEALIH